MTDINDNATDSKVVSNQHYSFHDIYKYVGNKRYPDNMKDRGHKANFRRAAKAFTVKNGKLTFLKKARDGSQKEVCRIF